MSQELDMLPMEVAALKRRVDALAKQTQPIADLAPLVTHFEGELQRLRDQVALERDAARRAREDAQEWEKRCGETNKTRLEVLGNANRYAVERDLALAEVERFKDDVCELHKKFEQQDKAWEEAKALASRYASECDAADARHRKVLSAWDEATVEIDKLRKLVAKHDPCEEYTLQLQRIRDAAGVECAIDEVDVAVIAELGDLREHIELLTQDYTGADADRRTLSSVLDAKTVDCALQQQQAQLANAKLLTLETALEERPVLPEPGNVDAVKLAVKLLTGSEVVWRSKAIGWGLQCEAVSGEMARFSGPLLDWLDKYAPGGG